jgi:hypothetical protein
MKMASELLRTIRGYGGNVWSDGLGNLRHAGVRKGDLRRLREFPPKIISDAIGRVLIAEDATLPSCPRCRSYASHRLANGTTDCQTCGANFPTVRMFWRN